MTRPSPCLSLSSWLYLPARSWNYSNKPITSSREDHEASYPLDTIKPASHSPWLFTVLKCNSYMTHSTVQSPPLSVCECMWPINCYLSVTNNILLVGVVCLPISITCGWQSLPYRQGEEKAINTETLSLSLKQEWLFSHRVSLTLFMPQFSISYCCLTYYFVIVTPYLNVDRDLSLTQLCISSRVYDVNLQIVMILIHMTIVYFCTLSHFWWIWWETFFFVWLNHFSL